MPEQIIWLDADEYVEWSTDNPEDDSVYRGGIGIIGGAAYIIWDPNQDPVIYPPTPRRIRPPNSTPPEPPRVKRPKVPPPNYS